MSLKQTFFAIFSTLILSSCVSSKVHKELQSQYDSLESRNQKLQNDLRDTRNKAEKDLAALQDEYNRMKAERDQLQVALKTSETNLASLTSSYDALAANSSSAIAENSKRNRELLAELEEKGKALRAEQQ